MDSAATPAAQQIRDHFKAKGQEVHISRDGHFQFRPAGETAWRGSRWLHEYRLSDTGQVILA